MNAQEKKKDGRQGKRKVKNSQSHFDFEDIEIYISRLGQYPSLILVKDFDCKTKFKRTAKKNAK